MILILVVVPLGTVALFSKYDHLPFGFAQDRRLAPFGTPRFGSHMIVLEKGLKIKAFRNYFYALFAKCL